MSRSQPTLTNPAKYFFSWKGSTGQVVYWDKENKKEVVVKLPFTFLPLDQLATIKGYNKRDESGYWSNECRNVSKDEFVVRTRKGIQQAGLYKDLADVRAKGAKYTKSIYIAYKKGDDIVLANFNAGGSALSAWIEFSKSTVVENGQVTITGKTHVPAANSISEYYVPIFEYTHSDDTDDKIAFELDKELQVYLSQYLASNKQEQHDDDGIDQSIGLATPEQIAEYDAKVKAMKAKKSEITDTASEFADDIATEFNESDIPDFA